jgi:hypothetical protein
MLTSIDLHHCAGVRVERHYPENNNSISLTIERKPKAHCNAEAVGLTLYDLPPAVTDKLLAAFAFDDVTTIEGNGKVAQLVRAAQALANADGYTQRDSPDGLKLWLDLERALKRFPVFEPEPAPAVVMIDPIHEHLADGPPPQRAPTDDPAVPMCELCGHPMPPGEEVFKYHGFGGPCPTTPAPTAAEPEPPLDGEGKEILF